MDIGRTLRGCIETERIVAGLYATFARMFTPDELFWMELASDELRHMETFQLGEAYEVFDGKSPEGPALPEETSVARTLDYLARLMERLETNPLSQEEALRTALRIEELMVEVFVNELLEEARDRYPKLRLGEIVNEERTHAEKIMQYMISKGISHYA